MRSKDSSSFMSRFQLEIGSISVNAFFQVAQFRGGKASTSKNLDTHIHSNKGLEV